MDSSFDCVGIWSARVVGNIALSPERRSPWSRIRLSPSTWQRASSRSLFRPGLAVLAAAPQQRQPDRIRKWALELAARVGHNKATVAPANKLARYAWAVATRDRDFEVHATAA
jgi:hypothetical protein